MGQRVTQRFLPSRAKMMEIQAAALRERERDGERIAAGRAKLIKLIDSWDREDANRLEARRKGIPLPKRKKVNISRRKRRKK